MGATYLANLSIYIPYNYQLSININAPMIYSCLSAQILLK